MCVQVCVMSVCVCVYVRQPVKDLFISFINFVAGLNAIVFIVVVAFFLIESTDNLARGYF